MTSHPQVEESGKWRPKNYPKWFPTDFGAMKNARKKVSEGLLWSSSVTSHLQVEESGQWLPKTYPKRFPTDFGAVKNARKKKVSVTSHLHVEEQAGDSCKSQYSCSKSYF